MNWKKVISIVLIGVLGLMCMTACQATAGTSEENHVPDTSTAAQENADNQVTGLLFLVGKHKEHSKAHCGNYRSRYC